MLNSLFIALLWLCPEVQTRTLVLDIERSEISFSVTHMGFLNVEGTFSEFEASLTLENDEISQIEGKIQVASINTDEPTRDKTLKDPGYLDAENFPVISFSSRSAYPFLGESPMTGQLRIKSEEREVVIPMQMERLESSIRLSAEVVIHRSKFNLDFGPMDALIGDEIQVSAKLAFIE